MLPELLPRLLVIVTFSRIYRLWRDWKERKWKRKL